MLVAGQVGVASRGAAIHASPSQRWYLRMMGMDDVGTALVNGVPVAVVNYVWTFHHKSSVGNATIKVTNAATSADMPMKTLKLSGGYGSYSTVGFQQQGWTAKAGDVFDVTVEGSTGGPISYQVSASACN